MGGIYGILPIKGGRFMSIDDIKVGGSYHVTSKYDCKSCFKVVVEEIVNDTSVRVRATIHKKNKKPKSFNLPISALHKGAKKAVHGYKQHHK